MKRERIIDTSQTGFIFVRGESFAVLKHPDGGVKKVPERFVDDLIQVAEGTVDPESFPQDFTEAVAQLRDEGYLFEGPVVELQRPSFSLLPYIVAAVALFAPYLIVAVEELDLLLAVLSSVSVRPPLWLFLYGPLVMLPTVAIHEWGHYREAGKHVPVSFGIGTINGLVPAFKTYTTETWLLGPRHRMWVNLAGVTYQSAAAMPLVLIYYFDLVPPLPGFAETLPWLLIGYVVGMFTFTLNPVYHGDGYLIMTDLLGEYNIRKKSRQAYRARDLNRYALYGLLSYGLVNVYMIVSSVLTLVVWGWIIGGILVGIKVLFIVVEYTESRAREFVSHEPTWVPEIRERIT